jgi:hypothetical protein
MRLLNLVGKKFGRLVVLSYSGVINERTHWLCRCSCGTEKIVSSNSLQKHNTRSCGCLALETKSANGKLNSKHRHKPTYTSWCCMHRRCTDPGDISYKNYGGRGIKVCKRWAVYEQFLADMGERPVGTSLDRLRVNGNYTPANCKWSTPSEQSTNQRQRYNVRKLTFRNKTKTISEWSRLTGISVVAIHIRLRAGWAIEKALTKPLRPRICKKYKLTAVV